MSLEPHINVTIFFKCYYCKFKSPAGKYPHFSYQACVQGREERVEPLGRPVVPLVRVAQPLDGADADRPVECARAEGEPVA